MSRKRILICPLNWGIGHASRCVPIINELLRQGQEVIIAADKTPLHFLQEAFPKLEFLIFPGFEPQYSSRKTQLFKTLTSIPALANTAIKDHKLLEYLVKAHHIDAVISDNRFGAYSNQVPSVFITHQLHISLPGLTILARPFVDGLNKYFIQRYSTCWIPDYESDPNLSGKLSHPAPSEINTVYIGPLSRFPQPGPKTTSTKKFDLLILLSGPEPQRSMLETKIINMIHRLSLNICILRGKPGSKQTLKQTQNLKIYNHASDKQIINLMNASDLVLARSGYSTIMDLVVLNQKACFVPTPGQTEQEYLARLMKDRGWFNYEDQESFDITNILSTSNAYAPPKLPDATQRLKIVVENWIMSL